MQVKSPTSESGRGNRQFSLLAIETSAEACSVALYHKGKSRVFHEHAPRQHAELLLPAVRRLLDEAEIALANLDAIAFGQGPGSFTSLRIGIGVVQGLAWAAELPVAPVSSLAAVAQEAARVSQRSDSPIRVALDARMNEVYTGDYRTGDDGLIRPIGVERVCAPVAIDVPAEGAYIAAGNGFERFEELRKMGADALEVHTDLWPTAEMVGRLALGWLETNQPLPATRAQPVYLRNKVAEKPATGTGLQDKEA